MFAGIGGFRTGLTNAGDFFMPVGWCEKDKHAQKAYRLLYGTEGEYFCDDARIINPADMPDFDLICGGFPCQPFSVAGQRLGFADERGTLFHEICRLAEARHPKYLLLENVSGLLTHEGGQTFLAILTALEQLGYSLEWCVVNSANFGVPQDRKDDEHTHFYRDEFLGIADESKLPEWATQKLEEIRAGEDEGMVLS